MNVFLLLIGGSRCHLCYTIWSQTSWKMCSLFTRACFFIVWYVCILKCISTQYFYVHKIALICMYIGAVIQAEKIVYHKMACLSGAKFHSRYILALHGFDVLFLLSYNWPWNCYGKVYIFWFSSWSRYSNAHSIYSFVSVSEKLKMHIPCMINVLFMINILCIINIWRGNILANGTPIGKEKFGKCAVT